MIVWILFLQLFSNDYNVYDITKLSFWHYFAVKPEDAVLKALIRRTAAQRMETKERFEDAYDTVLDNSDRDMSNLILFD